MLLLDRENDYKELTPQQFAKKYRYLLFKEVTLVFNDKEKYSIQLNFCVNPFCKWFGMPQKRYNNIKSKPSRYKLVSRNFSGIKSRAIKCNPDPIAEFDGISFNCKSMCLSNWSVGEEIIRLISINSTVDKVEEYTFHRDNCLDEEKTPFENPNSFYKRGKSSSKSQKWQCKSCKKMTNVLPSYQQNHGYYLHKTNILPLFTKLLISRTPVKRTCEILNISPKTYYHRLEMLYL